MFVKSSWNSSVKNSKKQYHIAESYRDPETKQPRHRLLMNITDLPEDVIEAIRRSLKGEKLVSTDDINITRGDSFRGAGLLAIYRAWKQLKMDKALSALPPCKVQSVFLMVAQRILAPGSKLSLRRTFNDTLFARSWNSIRFDEDELYETMDQLNEQFYAVQEALQESQKPVLFLYDTTSTYFEGRKAENAKYGHSKDHRWDRYQIVIGLVCNERGIPQAVEVWPGNTADMATVGEQIEQLSKRFDIEKVVFVGDKGMYSEANIESIKAAKADYILGLAWQRQKKQLLSQAPEQLSLFDEVGILEWEEDGVRYVGCASQYRKERDQKRRQEGMVEAEEQLDKLRQSCSKSRYYSWTSLRNKVNKILDKEHVRGLLNVSISPIGPFDTPEKKHVFDLGIERDEIAISERAKIEGKYVLETSLRKDEYTKEGIKEAYCELIQVEQAFRHIKSMLEIRPVYHRLEKRIRGHVLICYLAFYIIKQMELEFREKGITEQVEDVLKHWDTLQMSELTLEVNGEKRTDLDWNLGTNGLAIQNQISELGWWKSIQKSAGSLFSAAQKS